ncbi:ComEC/Rec2 family competence protein [Clostridium aestuarii]|uniref:ComEC/Rec2 family competence protein n=1 Tax=Clostridium aestuarii TaxID=338193 RepID=A0ABT4D2K7_9CLOT|nr:ComEC/Rec2 family competence protein [Clostridium aestuarii]MCY6484268.1 ComEC/Rec2 family competence protein [Clostridium aestuarii]
MKRPLIYYAIAVFMGCFSSIVLDSSILFGTVIAVLFFVSIFFTLDSKLFIIIISFFFIGCFSIYIYFNFSLSKKADFRIIENKNRYCIAKCKGRKIILLGNTNRLKDGYEITATGNFTYNKNYFNGVVGTYRVEKYIEKNKDFICKLYDMKRNIYYSYSEILGGEKTGIIMATAYGDTKYLSQQYKDQFNRLGICHIISVSGFHMALVYKILECIIGVKLALVSSFAYLMFTGAKAATIRAYVMIFILKLSKVVYKNYDSISALSLAAIILFLIRPYYILNIGFMLSFLSTLGIILYRKKIKRVLYKLPEKINNSLSITLSAQIFSMPYVMCTINNISLFFIPANLILVPLYSVLIFLANLGVLVYKVTPIFKIITSILYLIITAIDGANYILLKFAPPIIIYNYFYGIDLMILFMSYVFVKKGYRIVKYVPLLLLCFIIVYNVI